VRSRQLPDSEIPDSAATGQIQRALLVQQLLAQATA
jgi:hypothetical protein